MPSRIGNAFVSSVPSLFHSLPHKGPDTSSSPEKRGNMQEIVVQSTKYPEIVVQGSTYDYTSDIVLVVVGVLAAAAIIWRYSAMRRGKD